MLIDQSKMPLILLFICYHKLLYKHTRINVEFAYHCCPSRPRLGSGSRRQGRAPADGASSVSRPTHGRPYDCGFGSYGCSHYGRRNANVNATCRSSVSVRCYCKRCICPAAENRHSSRLRDEESFGRKSSTLRE